MGLKEWCFVFCWPPVPSKIAAKLAFVPPLATYDLVADPSGDKLTININPEMVSPSTSNISTKNIEGCFTTTKRGNVIACIFIKCHKRAKYTILFSHGNAVDIGHMCPFYISLSTILRCNIFSYDYSGYGVSSGKPTEKNMYSDIEAAANVLYTHFGIEPNNTILYGQSIGTVATVDLASKSQFAAIILHSPLMSGLRLIFPNTKRTCICDVFPSIDKVAKITSPTLVIHGTEDEIIDFTHGWTICERCPSAVQPLWVEGAGHSDVEMHPIYYERLIRFIHEELKTCKEKKCSRLDLDATMVAMGADNTYLKTTTANFKES